MSKISFSSGGGTQPFGGEHSHLAGGGMPHRIKDLQKN